MPTDPTANTKCPFFWLFTSILQFGQIIRYTRATEMTLPTNKTLSPSVASPDMTMNIISKFK